LICRDISECSKCGKHVTPQRIGSGGGVQMRATLGFRNNSIDDAEGMQILPQ